MLAKPHYKLEGFNADAAIERMLGNHQLWLEALGLFVEHFSGWEAEWLSSIGEDKLEQRKVHILRGAAMNIGAEELAKTAASLETLLIKRLSEKNTDIPNDLRQQLSISFHNTIKTARKTLN